MPPAPQGTAQQQLERQYAYLFQMAQQLNLALEQLPGSAQGVPVVSGGGAADSSEAQRGELIQQYNNLKSLIQRTAKEVYAQMDKARLELQGSYVAVSDFGTYLERLNSTIEADASAITQYYHFFSDLQANVETVSAAFRDYCVETEGYIRTGIVYYDGAVPVYGVAVGQNLTTTEIDGVKVVDQNNFRATYTASKLSFWQDAVEVAYVSNNRLYINNITALGSLTLGRWELTDSGGLSCKWIGG